MIPVRVLQVTSTPQGIGGVEKLLLDMAPHYDPTKVAVRHCNLFDGNGRFPTALKATGLPYEEVRGARWYHLPGMVIGLRRLIRIHRIEVLHLHMVHATILGLLVRLSGVSARVLVTKHYVYRAIRSPMLRSLDRLLTNRADAIIAVSNHVRDDLLANGADGSKVQVIHNGIDIEAFDGMAGATARPIRGAGDEILIGCVGNLNPIKGHIHLIRAMPRVLAEFPKARLILIGEGPEHASLQLLAASLGVENAVTFAGFRADVPPIMRQIDICVQPSLQESFGIVLLEAMAAGVAVVATNVEGIPEIVVDGVTGRLVPSADPDALGAALRDLIGDADTRRNMGAAGRKRVEAAFDIRRTVRGYEDLYARLAAANAPDRSSSYRPTCLPD